MTAELAVALPALLLVLAVALWGIGAGVAQIQCVDAARVAARALVRGEESAAAIAAAREVAPNGARVRVSEAGEGVRAVVTVDVRPPGSLPGRMFRLTVKGEAYADAEPS